MPTSRSQSKIWLPVVLLLAVFGAVLLLRSWMNSTPFAQHVLEQERTLMGTQWKIQLLVGAGDRVQPAQEAMEAALAEVARLESLMSEWRDDSPLSALNRSAGGGAGLVLPAELRAILQRGIEYGRLSQGAFDITWRGMGRLWRFDDQFRIPARAEIEAALERVGYQRIRIDGNRVELTRAGMAIGLGGIAKGYAVDRAAAVLRQRGFENFLVDGGGDVLAQGSRGQRAWRIGIRDPRGGRQDMVGTVRLAGQALASSGDYERYRIHQGVRYHHIIDPRSGFPAQGSRAVSVLAPSAEEADALATAIFVLGPQAGLDLAARRPGVEALIIDDQGRQLTTPGFEIF